MNIHARDATGPVIWALVRRLGGRVTLTEQELDDVRKFNATANVYDDRVTISLHFPRGLWPDEYEDDIRKIERTFAP